MRLQTLYRALKQLDPEVRLLFPQKLEVTGASDDSRAIAPGYLFAALPGVKADGNAFVRPALEAGAAALLVSHELKEYRLVPQLVSKNPRRTLGHIASILYGEPSRHMKVIGITGTNGKTTSAFLLREILEACGIPCGLMGTVWNIVGGEQRTAKLTTPGAVEVHRTLAEMRAHGQQACIMEVSSHALSQDRVAGVNFAGAIFTNLTRDHLDYHGDFDTYFDAKARLFESLQPGTGFGVVNLDAEYGARMMQRSAGIALGVGQHDNADMQIEQVEIGLGGMSFGLRWLDRAAAFTSPLTGRYNVENVAGAVSMALALDLPVQNIRAAVQQFRGAPGRLERVAFDHPAPTVFVDYAHTPDAMENVLSTLRKVCAGRKLVCIFGCGGDRDRTKRPQMGAIGAALADRPIITSDNPRSEDPVAIIDEIVAGVPPQQRLVETYVDRREAIRRAVAEAGADDVILIVGKGHETYQIFSDRTVHFDDREEARSALETFWGVGSGRRAVGV
jgi:UDP-N-acetylmuramoyl-L-alanyl-D-glutamate--2,6-diaminopimelate ligase